PGVGAPHRARLSRARESVEPDLRLARDFAEALALLAQVRRDLVHRQGIRLEAGGEQLFLHVRSLHGFLAFGREPLTRLAWNARGRDEPDPRAHVEVGYVPSFDDRRELG